MRVFKNIVLVLFIGLFILGSCSTKKNTFISRQYHNFTTYYNIYFNGKESLKQGEEKIKANHTEVYSFLLPIFITDDVTARKSAFSSMDRATVKAEKAIKLHSISQKPRRKSNRNYKYYKKHRNKKEYNSFIDDCYLLGAKGNFYNKKYAKSGKTFEYLIRNFEGEAIVDDARLWYARSLVDQGEFNKATEQLKAISSRINIIPKSLKVFYYKVYADLYVKSGDASAAIKSLEKLINVVSDRKSKIRYKYILAQLFLNEGMEDAALTHFSNISKMRVSYDIAFNASISMALAYNGSNGGGIRRMLKRMLNDDRNVNLKDQIYYAFGHVEMKDGNIEKGIGYMRQSTKTSVDNDMQKSMSYHKLGDYYYGRKDYNKAYVCYDSCVYLNPSAVLVDKEVVKRRNNLAELVSYLNKINRQDSLRMLADMPLRQREKIIQAKIDKIVKDEMALKQSERDAQLDRSFYMQNRASVNSLANNSGGWYFYNPVSVSMGRSEYIRKWGKRRLEDNWRRKNKAAIDISVVEDVENGLGNDMNKVSKQDLKSKEYYLKNIPLSRESKAMSDSIIVESLFNVACLLEEKINDNEEALKGFEELIKRYPENKYLIYACYNAYKLATYVGDYSKAEKYKADLINKFPNSRYAVLLKDPDYRAKQSRDINTVEQLYERAYKAYNNYSYKTALSLLDNAMAVYPKNLIVDKVLLLKALCIGRLDSKQAFVAALQKVLLVKPAEEVKDIVNNLLASMDKGAMPVAYGAGDIEYARSLKKSRDWYFKQKPRQVVEKKKELYEYINKGQFHFVMSVNSKFKYLNRLIFNVNLIAENVIDHSGVRVKKELIGVSDALIVVSGLKDIDEAKRLYNAIKQSRRIETVVGNSKYDLFYIADKNFKVIQYNRDMDIYMSFFKENYLKKHNNNTEDNVNSASGNIFKKDMHSNHKFILLFSSDKIKTNKVVAALNSYDGDYTNRVDKFDDKYDIVVVDNVGNSVDAIRYLSGFRKYLNRKGSNEFAECRMLLISDDNYELFFTKKYLKEYSLFFDKNYKIEDLNVEENKPVNNGLYIFDEKQKHSFVLVFPSDVDKDKLIKGFNRYNIDGLKDVCYDFKKGSKMMVVSNMENKKQAMMYFRAVITNRDLFKPLKSKRYRNFVISDKNLKILRKTHKLDEYIEFFRKRYLNR